MNDHGFGNDVQNRHSRIQGGKWILEDELYPAAIGKEILILQREDICHLFAVMEADAATVGSCGAQNELACCRFSATGLPDQSKAFPPADRKAYVIDGLNPRLMPSAENAALTQGEAFADMFDFQKWVADGPRVARLVAQQAPNLGLDLTDGNQPFAR